MRNKKWVCRTFKCEGVGQGFQLKGGGGGQQVVSSCKLAIKRRK